MLNEIFKQNIFFHCEIKYNFSFAANWKSIKKAAAIQLLRNIT